MTWSELPARVRLIFGLASVFLAVEIFIGTLFLMSTSIKIDPGLATLVGAIVGLGIVGWQARLGFGNLIHSQENQAKLEREGREHQHSLDESKRERERTKEREMLQTAIRAEIVSLMSQVSNAQAYSTSLKEIAGEFAKQGKSSTTKEVKMHDFEAPIFQSNISKLGLLGISLAADVIMVCLRAKPTPPMKFDVPIPNGALSILYEANARSLSDWHDDLYHVALRIRAFEENTPDPGTLTAHQGKRRESQMAAKQKVMQESP